jgi:hypothetical protein
MLFKTGDIRHVKSAGRSWILCLHRECPDRQQKEAAHGGQEKLGKCFHGPGFFESVKVMD